MVYRKYFKRPIDIVFSFIGIIILFPLFVLIALLIKIDSKGPVFFKQLRVGKDKKDFLLLKFRTMKLDAPSNTPTFLLENPENHITRIGKFLRKTSLDELPQLINIFKGEMSIIGPRPVIRQEVELFKEREKRGVYTVRPGLSGWAQVNGRDEVTVIEKAELDGYYINNISFFFDIKIFLLTIYIVLRTKGIKEGAQISEDKKTQIK